ncbi:hypothetical protein DCO58_10860 [Helicobacter saguini]|uniref:Transmembrane protein n=2 Tax=Helicobacter saguini TaxID=1548018 RepID=A0A347VPU9_9HELI|nr:hypothetical protein [Helicobacter saguini]MWV61202.1 hypothetical protein [Helicobacter saguini]MWV68131.1 hypothetical protein [Helicobacter saguini]MWV70405.1 hypothetical protein [Helicobacter saguini]TLD95344.1 hypothetical protein LS64_003115 [Helicobacter saguini]
MQTLQLQLLYFRFYKILLILIYYITYKYLDSLSPTHHHFIKNIDSINPKKFVQNLTFIESKLQEISQSFLVLQSIPTLPPIFKIKRQENPAKFLESKNQTPTISNKSKHKGAK